MNDPKKIREFFVIHPSISTTLLHTKTAYTPANVGGKNTRKIECYEYNERDGLSRAINVNEKTERYDRLSLRIRVEF